MARLLTLCSLPRTNPGGRLQYKRVNGPYTLIMTATGEYKLPFGPLPRLLMAWLSTEAIAPLEWSSQCPSGLMWTEGPVRAADRRSLLSFQVKRR